MKTSALVAGIVTYIGSYVAAWHHMPAAMCLCFGLACFSFSVAGFKTCREYPKTKGEFQR